MIHKSPSYRADIDGLRAVAVLAVLVYHLDGAWLPGGFLGVDVFFVISGYVVTAALMNNPGTTLGSFISEFYARRLARILPALVAMLVVAGILAVLFIPQAWLSKHGDDTGRYALFGLSNWFLQQTLGSYFAPRAEFNPYTHTWSLGVEEQFYLLAPFLVYLWRRAVLAGAPRWRQAALVGLLGLTAASLAFCAWASTTHPSLAFYFIGSRLWELALGSVLLLMTRHQRPCTLARGLQSGLPWLGLVALALALGAADLHHFPWPWAMPAAVGTLLLIGGTNAELNHPVRRLLASAPAVWVGLRSYSLYLWHWPIYVLLRWTVGLEGWAPKAVAVLASLVLAGLSYRWIERPLRHNPRIESRDRWIRLCGFLALPVLGLLTLNHLFEHRQSYSLASASRTPKDWNVSPRMEFADLGPRRCTVAIDEVSHGAWTERRYRPEACEQQHQHPTIFVLGDSHAGAMAPQYEQFSAEIGATVRMLSVGGCSFMDFKQPMLSDPSAVCAQFAAAALSLLESDGKPGDVVLLPSLRLERYGDQWARFKVEDVQARMYNAQTAVTRQAALLEAQSVIARLSARGLRTVFAAPLPVFKAPAFRCVDWFNEANPICKGGHQMPLDELQRLRAPVMSAMQALQTDRPLVDIWDPLTTLCPAVAAGSCSSMLEGRPLFFDGDHLSAYGNFKLYPSLKAMLLRAPPAAAVRPTKG